MELINSRPFQRLRYIHQLALSYLVYPGATHKRFEHSLGVMELAGRAFDAITHRENVDEEAQRLFPQITTIDFLVYWRKILRLAALCHDLGHPPFSHAGEELFPKGFSHEQMTRVIVESEELKSIFKKMTPRVAAEDVVKLALGPKEAKDVKFNDWELLLAEIITGNSLGVDRMDYLLRDAYHAGVGYGKFDHFRLLETIRIVVPPPVPQTQLVQKELLIQEPLPEEKSTEPALGVLYGGLHSSEALLLARYFMYAQVYYHPVRVAYNYHLQEFLGAWLPNHSLPINYEDHLALSDNEVATAIRISAHDSSSPGHEAARRIFSREHFKLLRQFVSDELTLEPLMPSKVFNALEEKFGKRKFILHRYKENKNPQSFTVRLRDGRTISSLAMSAVLRQYPRQNIAFILVEPKLREQASEWLKNNFNPIET